MDARLTVMIRAKNTKHIPGMGGGGGGGEQGVAWQVEGSYQLKAPSAWGCAQNARHTACLALEYQSCGGKRPHISASPSMQHTHTVPVQHGCCKWEEDEEVDGVQGESEGAVLLKQVEVPSALPAKHSSHNTVPQGESWRGREGERGKEGERKGGRRKEGGRGKEGGRERGERREGGRERGKERGERGREVSKGGRWEGGRACALR